MTETRRHRISGLPHHAYTEEQDIWIATHSARGEGIPEMLDKFSNTFGVTLRHDQLSGRIATLKGRQPKGALNGPV